MTYATNEELLRAAAETGGVANFRDRTVDDQARGVSLLTEPPPTEIQAELIRKVLTGIRRTVDQAGAYSPTNVTSRGVRLFYVSIAGDLDLDDATGPNGNPLPRLEFINCWFKGKQIRLARSRLRSLTIRGCAFRELLASEATIEGPVDLSYSRSADENGDLCWVVMAGAQIAGRVYAGYSHFAAPAKRDITQWVRYSVHSRYALDLRATRIHGSVHLRPCMSARGGVCLTLAKIDGSLWANGAHFVADEEWAFAADYAEVQGSLYFRPYDAPKKDLTNGDDPNLKCQNADFRAEGCMSLFAAKIGGSVYFEGAKLIAPDGQNRDIRWERKTVINLSTASIGGHCLFRGWIREGADTDQEGYVADSDVRYFFGDGEINLSASIIRNDLDFDGAVVRSVIANNVEVFGDCDFSPYSRPKVQGLRPFLACRFVNFEGGIIRGNLVLNGARLGTLSGTENEQAFAITDSRQALIDSGEMDERFKDEANATEEMLRDGTKRFSDGRNGLFAQGINIGGNCFMGTCEENEVRFRFECAGVISMQEARIGNSLRMDGALVVGPRQKTTIDLSGALIGGKASFMTWDKSSTEMGLAFKLWGGNIGLKLPSAKIAQELILNGAQIRGSQMAFRADNIEIGGKASLGTYEDNKLQKHNLFSFTAFGKVSLVSATIKLGIDMSGAKLHGNRIENQGQNLNTADALDLSLVRTKYVRLCAHNDCITGIAHDKADRSDFVAGGRVLLKHADIDADLFLQGSSFDRPISAEFARVGGSVHLVDVKIVSELFDSNETDGQLCKKHIQRSLTPDLSLNGIEVGGSLKVENFVQRNPSSALPQQKPRHLTVDLRGADVGELDDLGGTGWGEDLRLWLEGFRYARLPETAVVRRVPQVSAFHPCRLWDPSWISGSTRKKRRELGEKKRSGLWRQRALWLRRQYFVEGKPTRGEYSPDAYEQVIQGMNSTGSYEDARHITSIRLTLDGKHSQRGLLYIFTAFRVLFDYGLSVKRAIITFALCLLIGWSAASIANQRRVLVLNMSPPESRVVGRNSGALAHPLRAIDAEVYDTDVSCGKHIQPLLYALDVFVPVLDLRQQAACSVSDEHPLWRAAQASYAVLGWVITPLLILTCSGLLRRHLEK